MWLVMECKQTLVAHCVMGRASRTTSVLVHHVYLTLLCLVKECKQTLVALKQQERELEARQHAAPQQQPQQSQVCICRLMD